MRWVLFLASMLVFGALGGCVGDAAAPAVVEPGAPSPTARPPPEPEPEPSQEPEPEPTQRPRPSTSAPAPTTPALPPEEPPQDANGDAFVVIALVDSGINVYHEDFRRPGMTEHPSTFIPGYPSDASRVDITLGTGSVSALASEDKDAWDRVQTGSLYWFPGTNIIGAKSVTPGDRPVLDDHGHGTAVASVAAGQQYGSCPECLIVFIEGLGALDWALKQPWIDMVSNSYGPCAPPLCATWMPTGGVFSPPSKRSSEEGQVVLFSAGNGVVNAYDVPQPTYANHYTGPDWIVTVGANVPSGHAITGAGKPVDISSFGNAWPAAGHRTTSEEITFGGTSCAAPVTAGVFGQVLLEARRALGDHEGGHADGVVAEGTPVEGSPFLADGALTRAELYHIVTRTAHYPTGTSGYIYPVPVPATPLDPLVLGWGVASKKSAEDGVAWMLDGKAPPAKPVADEWMPVHSSIRVAMYGSWRDGGDGGPGGGLADVGSGGDGRPAWTGGDVTTWEQVLEAFESATAA